MNDNISVIDIYDKNFRLALKANPKHYIKQLYQIDLAEDIDVKIIVNTSDVAYFVIPDKIIESHDLQDIQAAKKFNLPHSVSTAGSAGTILTASTASTCLASLGTTSTIGTAGTANVGI